MQIWTDAYLCRGEVMRSDFEKLFTAQKSYRSVDKEAFIRGCEAAYKHQQSKVDELQKQLIDQGQRFNEQSQRVKDLEHKNEELQKRVDEQGLIIAKVMSIASDLQKSWEMFEIGKRLEQALKGDEA